MTISKKMEIAISESADNSIKKLYSHFDKITISFLYEMYNHLNDCIIECLEKNFYKKTSKEEVNKIKDKYLLEDIRYLSRFCNDNWLKKERIMITASKEHINLGWSTKDLNELIFSFVCRGLRTAVEKDWDFCAKQVTDLVHKKVSKNAN